MDVSVDLDACSSKYLRDRFTLRLIYKNTRGKLPGLTRKSYLYLKKTFETDAIFHQLCKNAAKRNLCKVI